MSEHPHARLRAAGYREVERWRIEDMLHFVRREVGIGTWPVQVLLASLLSLVGIGLVAAYWALHDGAALFGDIVLPFGLGCVGMLAIVVPHELLHGLAYRLAGAQRVVYGAEWRSLMFHASAPEFVLSAQTLYAVALLPMAVLSPICLAGLLLLSGWWWWVVLGVLLMHTQGCVGDVAIVSYFVRQVRPSDWVTYDDAETQEVVLLCRTEATTNTNAHTDD